MWPWSKAARSREGIQMCCPPGAGASKDLGSPGAPEGDSPARSLTSTPQDSFPTSSLQKSDEANPR